MNHVTTDDLDAARVALVKRRLEGGTVRRPEVVVVSSSLADDDCWSFHISVTCPDPIPARLYWRARTLDEFDKGFDPAFLSTAILPTPFDEDVRVCMKAGAVVFETYALGYYGHDSGIVWIRTQRE